MSYNLDSPCYYCQLKDSCSDEVVIQGAINTIHQLKGGHLGSGVILLSCNRKEMIDKNGEPITAPE